MKTLEQVEFSQPNTLSDALGLLARESTRGRLLAGGTDLIVQWQAGAITLPERAIDISNIAEIQYVRDGNDCVLIGAGATHARLKSDPLVVTHLPALAAACATVGARQIQNRGTIGGNVANASPAGDTHPPLLVTDGFVVVASVSGERRIPLASFFLDYRKIDLRPDEMIIRFELPKRPEGAHEHFHKIGTRNAQAISKVMGACRAVVADGVLQSIAIALGSVAATAKRLAELEAWLTGKTLDTNLIAEAEQRAAAEVRPIADIRSTAEYRKWVSGRLVRSFLQKIADV